MFLFVISIIRHYIALKVLVIFDDLLALACEQDHCWGLLTTSKSIYHLISFMM